MNGNSKSHFLHSARDNGLILASSCRTTEADFIGPYGEHALKTPKKMIYTAEEIQSNDPSYLADVLSNMILVYI